METDYAALAPDLCLSDQRRLEAFIGRRTRSAPDPAETEDDLVQQVLLISWLRYDPGRAPHPDSGMAFVFATARSVAIDAVKRRLAARRRRHGPNPAQPPRGGRGSQPEAASSQAPFALACEAELDGLVREGIQRLPADYQCVIELCDLAGLSVSEVAAMLNRSVDAVRKLRRRARQALARDLAHLRDDLDER